MKLTVKSIARGAVIAAMYVAFTLIFQVISFREIQFRITEVLTILPVLCVEAIPGVFIGCLLANLLAGAVWFDVVFGALATLIAAILTRKFRDRPLLAASMPVILNGAIVGPVVYFGYVYAPGAFSLGTLLLTIVTVSAGEAAVMYILGIPFLHAVKKLPQGIL